MLYFILIVGFYLVYCKLEQIRQTTTPPCSSCGERGGSHQGHCSSPEMQAIRAKYQAKRDAKNGVKSEYWS